MSYPYIIQGNNITAVIDNATHTINRSHVAFEKIKEAIKVNDWDTVKELIVPKKAVISFGAGNVNIDGDRILWRGEEMHNALTERMLQMLKEDFPVQPLVNFMENLMQNPSNRAIRELYSFLEKNNLPITPDGHFLAYKNVRENYYDIYSGQVPNKPASLLNALELEQYPITTKNGVTVKIVDNQTVVSMERNAVDDNREVTCSNGLHVCSHSYLSVFNSVGGHTLIVKVNPRDVVSVPADHNDQKLRNCVYVVVGEAEGDESRAPKAFTKPVQTNANNAINVAKPKLGSTFFYKGYTDGFNGNDYDSGDYLVDERDYEEGYEKGQYHREEGIAERYRYVKPAVEVTATTWPYPNNRV